MAMVRHHGWVRQESQTGREGMRLVDGRGGVSGHGRVAHRVVPVGL